MLHFEDWDKIKTRFEAFWENEIIDRCCASIVTRKDGVFFDREKYKKPQNHEDILEWYRDPELALERGMAEINSYFYGGEALPLVGSSWGGSGYSLYLDCKHQYTEDSLWFSPTIHSAEDYVHLKFDPQNKIFLEHQAYIKYLVERSEGRFMIAQPEYIGNFDAVLSMRGTEEALMDMYDEPEKIHLAISAVREASKIAGEAFYETVKENNCGGTIVPWFNTWSKGKQYLVQCDNAAMLSPQMFEEFILPDLEETSNWLDCAAYHIDGQEQLKFLDMLLSVKGIKAFQWTNVAGQPSVLNYLHIFRKIQKAGKRLIVYCKPEWLEELLSGLSPRGLFINVEAVEDEASAREIITKIGKWTGNKKNH